MSIRRFCLDMSKYIRTFVVSKLNNNINNLKLTIMAQIYVVKMTNKRLRQIAVDNKAKCECWNGVTVRSYVNRKDATKYARECNRTAEKFYKYRMYFTVEELELF